MGPAKDKYGIRENFAKIFFFIREEWPFRDKGILNNNYIYNLKYYIDINLICKGLCLIRTDIEDGTGGIKYKYLFVKYI